jgi:hypothetical protein
MADLTTGCVFIARRALGIGDFQFGPGDELTADAIACLPPGRLEVLVRNDFVDKVSR